MPALFFCLAGCASIPDHVRDLPRDDAQVELTDTPFHPQSRYQCGPAALTTVLQASGAAVELDDITAKVYIPERQGSLQLEMLAATRTSGRLPYLVDGTLSALLAELEAGRPVVLLQNLGIASIPRWHYAVVVGIDGARQRVILRSGKERRRETPSNVFLRTWSRSDFWGMVALRPGELPAQADRARYIEAVVALEQTGQTSAAMQAWRAATQRWPDDATARFGLGNAHFAAGEYRVAETQYREVLAKAPDLIAVQNNLALSLAHQHRFDEALDLLDAAQSANTEPQLELVLAETREEILAMMN